MSYFNGHFFLPFSVHVLIKFINPVRRFKRGSSRNAWPGTLPVFRSWSKKEKKLYCQMISRSCGQVEWELHHWVASFPKLRHYWGCVLVFFCMFLWCGSNFSPLLSGHRVSWTLDLARESTCLTPIYFLPRQDRLRVWFDSLPPRSWTDCTKTLLSPFWARLLLQSLGRLWHLLPRRHSSGWRQQSGWRLPL